MSSHQKRMARLGIPMRQRIGPQKESCDLFKSEKNIFTNLQLNYSTASSDN